MAKMGSNARFLTAMAIACCAVGFVVLPGRDWRAQTVRSEYFLPMVGLGSSAAQIGLATFPLEGQREGRRFPSRLHNVLATYDAELRRPDGRVDIEAMVPRLKELGVTTYYWLVFHATTDWDDLKLFLPKAAQAGIAVTVYLVPPSESPPYTKLYSEPFRLDFQRWAQEIARLSLQHPNLTSWVIDDFYGNRRFFTPSYIREMLLGARQINPGLKFLPLMYFSQIMRGFVEDYRDVIDGVVVAYPADREEIDRAWAILNDTAVPMPCQLSFPLDTPSRPGDFISISNTAGVTPSDRYEIRFREEDDYTGSTAGYHFKQLLVDGEVAWEADVAGGTLIPQDVVVDVGPQVQGKEIVTIAFRLYDKKGVSNFDVDWCIHDLQTVGLRLAADLTQPEMWNVGRQGNFETDFGDSARKSSARFHIPFIVMTAAQEEELRARYGDPSTPERIAELLGISLQAYGDAKCNGVVTYCLDLRPQSPSFPLAAKLFHEFAPEKR